MSVRSHIDAALKDRPDDWRSALARTLADALDDEPNASMARELRALMNNILDDMQPAETSKADELRARRAARIAGAKAQ